MKRGNKGFTLIEMIALLTMMSLGLLFAFQVFSLAIDARRLQVVARELGRDTSETCMRFSRETRTVRGNTDVLVATGSEVRFVDISGTNIRYWLNGNNLMRNNQILLDQMNALAFTYYDANGNQIVNPLVSPSSTNIRFVRMLFTVQREGRSLNMMSEARMRNVQ